MKLLENAKKYLPCWFGDGVTLFVCDAFDAEKVKVYKADTLPDALRQAFDYAPSNARLFLNNINPANDITVGSVDFFNRVQGRVICLNQPADPFTIISVVSIALSVAAVFLAPSVPDVNGTSAAPSPTNSLSERGNRQRLGQRVQDGFGTNWMIPDLLAPTYSVYVDHDEIENSYMALGVGEYKILDAMEETTKAAEIPGNTVQVFRAGENFSNHQPQKQFGNDLSPEEKELSGLLVKRYKTVNGQVLPSPESFLQTSNNIQFVHPNIIRVTEGIDFTAHFKAGGTIQVEAAESIASAGNITVDHDNDPNTDPEPVTYSLNGVYVIDSVTATDVVLTSPENINPDWTKLTTHTDSTVTASPVLSHKGQSLWQGWFYTDQDDAEGLLANVVAPNGLYETDGSSHVPLFVFFDVEYEKVDTSGNPIANTLQTETIVLKGRGARNNVYSNLGRSSDDNIRMTAAQTFKFDVAGRVRFRIKRETRAWGWKGHSVSQEVRIKDFFSYRAIKDSDHPAQLTTIYSKTKATSGALSFRERQLKILAQRKVRDWANNDALIATNDAEHIFYHAATAPHIGNRDKSELDMTQISAEMAAQRAYFQTNKCGEFCHVFDNDKLSTEETLQTIAQAVFCTANRFGDKIRMHFEQPEPMSITQFTAYNMLPDSYKRTEHFRAPKNYDGIELTFKSEIDDSPVVKRYPDQGERNPEKVRVTGVRNDLQAHIHMMRRYQRQQHAKVSVEFTGMDETNVILPTHRINVANRTDARTQAGQVEDLTIDTQNNRAILTTSDPVAMQPDKLYTVFIQQTNRTVDNIAVTQGDSPYELVLARLPDNTVSFGSDVVVNATYEVVDNEHDDRSSFLVTSKTPAEGLSHDIEAINYTDKYYAHDKDHVTGAYQARPV